MITNTTTRSKVASEVQDDMFDNWGDDGFGESKVLMQKREKV